MPQSRKEHIAQIIQQRKPFLHAIEIVQASLQKRAEALMALEKSQKQIMQSSAASHIRKRIESLPIAGLRQEIEKAIRELEIPKKRFARETINIGVVGRAGQGKSRLLQSLSDLDHQIIPSGSRGHCTGVRSIVQHDPSQQPHGKITFYSEQDLMSEVIAPYYQKLPQLGPMPRSFDNFMANPLPAAQGNGSGGQTQLGEMIRHLHEYQSHARTYRPLLGLAPQRVSTGEIREYVAQDDVQGTVAYHKHLAVREAQIVCTFQHPDVGQIALVDMPGLGDTGVGDENRLVQALGEHIDIVLYTFIPGAKRAALQDVDFQLYDTIYQALDGIPLERWSFMVLNHTRDDDNYANCERIQRQVLSGQTGTGENRLKFVDCLIADCQDQHEAKTIILDRVLEYLGTQMHSLDETYISAWDRRLEILGKAITNLLTQVQQAIGASTEQSTRVTETGRLFDEIWHKFEAALINLRGELAKESSTESAVLKKYFGDKFNICRSDAMLPPPERIEKYLLNFNAPYGAMNLLINEMRTGLTRQFAQIDVQLQLDDMKRKVAETFKQAGNLTTLAENTTGKDFFRVMEGKMPPEMRIQQDAFRAFALYELSLQGVFQNLIRKNLNLLDPNRPDFFQFNSTPSAQQMQTALKKARDETINAWQGVVTGWLRLPNEATFAVVSELIDQTLYSEQAEARWKEFYLMHAGLIWVSHFADSATREELFRRWRTAGNDALKVHTTEPLLLSLLARQAVHP